MTTSAPTAADLDAAQTALSVARAEHAVTSEKVTIAYNLMKNLRATETKSILTGRSHEDFWTDMIPDDLQGRNDLSRVVHGGAAPVDAAARRAVPSFMTQRAVTASPPA